jgi:hypothetical protein
MHWLVEECSVACRTWQLSTLCLYDRMHNASWSIGTRLCFFAATHRPHQCMLGKYCPSASPVYSRLNNAVASGLMTAQPPAEIKHTIDIV